MSTIATRAGNAITANRRVIVASVGVEPENLGGSEASVGGPVRFTKETAAEFGRRGAEVANARRRTRNAVSELQAALKAAVQRQVDIDDIAELGRAVLTDTSFAIVASIAIRILQDEIKVNTPTSAANIARLFYEIGVKEAAARTGTGAPGEVDADEIEGKVSDLVAEIQKRKHNQSKNA